MLTESASSFALFLLSSLVCTNSMRSLSRRRLGSISQRQKSTTSTPTKSDVLKRRKKFFSNSQSVSYENTEPLMMMYGEGSRLIDEIGISYLDTRNNVPHCGHSHPNVVRAVQKQVAALNTNTRYLHPTVVELAEKLTSRMPDPLKVVFFTNSGSEANDLALRLARAYSGSQNTIVVDRAYHGHTLATLEISPYKYECGSEYHCSETPNLGIARSPGSHIWKTPCPDVYRGEFQDPKTAGLLYANDVEKACQHFLDRGEKVRAFIMESGLSIGGVILPPSGYLAACAKAVRQAGGLFIADEVQTGCGRIGSHFWAFQYQSSKDEEVVVPDIVTIGKPLGNGMPIAAVVTSKEVAAAFESKGVEYFNTFGGNPVCAAAAVAVLDTISDEGLQQNALEVGTYLRGLFQELAGKPNALIGDVRGSGLFLGVELVRDKVTKEAATEETSVICSTLKSKYYILTTIDGAYENVIVIKPPLAFSREDADYFVDSFEKAMLLDLPKTDLSKIGITPT